MEALEVDTIFSKRISVPKKVVRGMYNMHIHTKALSVQGVEDKQIAVLIG